MHLLYLVCFFNSESVFLLNSHTQHLNFSHVCRWSSKLIRFQIYFCKFHIQNHLNSISPHLHPLLDRFLLQNEIQHVYISQVCINEISCVFIHLYYYLIHNKCEGKSWLKLDTFITKNLLLEVSLKFKNDQAWLILNF